MKLKDKVVVITGSGSGIGRYCAIEFAKNGAKVVVADINQTGAEETIQQIVKDGGEAVMFKVDISKPESVMKLVKFTLTTYSKIDVLVNNAAIQINKTVDDMTFEEWNQQMSINVGGVFLCSKYLSAP